jgi:hypothetical protein
MQKYAGACSPDQVHMLQEICDVVMRELRANGTISLSEDIELLRDVIAGRVMSQFYGDGLKRRKTVLTVLKSFGVDHPAEQA